jgi:hypothetical protein
MLLFIIEVKIKLKIWDVETVKVCK